jgi:hypothetical protein
MQGAVEDVTRDTGQMAVAGLPPPHLPTDAVMGGLDGPLTTPVEIPVEHHAPDGLAEPELSTETDAQYLPENSENPPRIMEPEAVEKEG